MARLIYWFTAMIIALVHPVVTAVTAFGWLWDKLFYIHGFLILLTMASWVILGHCFLSDWEYRIRKKLNPDMKPYDHGYLYYHLRKLSNIAPKTNFVRQVGLPFLFLMLTVWCFNFYVHTIA